MKFWDNLWDELVMTCEKYNFELVDNMEIWLDEEKEYIEDKILQNIEERRQTKGKPVGFSIDKVFKNQTSLRVTIMEWDDNISIRISFYDKEDELVKPDVALEEICKNIGLSRTYKMEKFKYINNKITFYGKGISEPTYELFDEKEFKNYVDIVSGEIINIIEALSNQEKQIIKILNEIY